MFSAPWTETTMSDPYLDALEQLDQMRDRAFKAEAAIARVRALHEFDGVHSCLGCRDNAPWPCDTIRALEGDSDD